MRRIVFFVAFFCGFYGVWAEGSTSEEIMEKVNGIMCPKTSKSKNKMIIKTSRGNERMFVSMNYAMNGGEKSLMKYLSPVQVKDQATLMLNNADDIWIYFPRTRRVRKLATHAKKQKVQGSDFSYEDMGSGDSWIKEFDSKLLKDEEYNGKDFYSVRLWPNEDSDSHYSKLELLVNKDNFYPELIRYFHEDDPSLLEKILVSENIQRIQGIPTALKMTMKNKLDQSETVLLIDEVEYNQKIDEGLFSKRGMKK